MTTVGRPDVVDAMVAYGVPPAHAEGCTRTQMEAGDLPRIKGRKTANRASYVPQHGTIALFGIAGSGPSDGHAAYASFLPLEAKDTSGGIVMDLVGRLLPDILVKDAEHGTEDPIKAVPFLTAFLTNISTLPDKDAHRLERSPEAQSVRLELSTDPAFMVFRWKSESVEHFVRFEHPSPLGDLFGENPPAFQRTTTFLFPLLFKVGRLFAGVAARSGTTVSPSGTGNPASLDENSSAPENEKAPDLPGSRASTRFQSCNGALKRSYTTGVLTNPKTSVAERETQAPKQGEWKPTPQKGSSHAVQLRRTYPTHAYPA